MEIRPSLQSLLGRVLPYVRRRAFRVEAACLLLSLLLSRVELFSAIAPMGLAFLLAVDLSGRAPLWYPVAGLLLGSLTCSPPHWANMGAALAYLGLRMLCRLRRKRAGRADKLALFALSGLLMLPLFFRGSLESWLTGFAGAGLSLLLGGLFYKALAILPALRRRRMLSEEEQLALCVLLGAAALAFAPVAFGDFSLPSALLCFLCLFAAYARGMPAVAAAAAFSGMLVLGGEANPVYVASLSACTLCGAFCRRMGPWGVAAGFGICCAAIDLTLTGILSQMGFFNFLPAAGGFLLIPGSAMLALRSLFDTAAREERRGRTAFAQMRRTTAGALKRTAEAVNRVAALLPNPNVPVYDPALEGRYMAEAAGHICADCTGRAACWRAPDETLNALVSMLPAHGQGYRPRPKPPLDAGCRRTAALCAAAAQAQAQYRACCTTAAQAQADRAAASRALADTGGVLSHLAEDVSAAVWEDEGLVRSINGELMNAGLRARCTGAVRSGGNARIALRLPRKRQEEMGSAVDCAARAAGRPLRLLSEEEAPEDISLEYRPALTAQVGLAQAPRGGSRHNGDTMAHRALPKGRELFVVSDGMGSGAGARAQSMAAVDLLLSLSEAGYPLDMALSCVNYMRPALQQPESFATMDVLDLDLSSGEASFVKLGAPPSFVLRAGQVHTVYAEALPAGIVAEASPAVHRAVLTENDAVVLLTDGALDALGRDAADRILINVGGANTPQDAAESLLAAARAVSDGDDMSVMVVRIA